MSVQINNGSCHEIKGFNDKIEAPSRQKLYKFETTARVDAMPHGLTYCFILAEQILCCRENLEEQVRLLIRYTSFNLLDVTRIEFHTKRSPRMFLEKAPSF